MLFRPGVALLTLAFLVPLGISDHSHAQPAFTWDEVSHPERFVKALTRPECPDGFQQNHSGTTTYCLLRGLKVPKKAKADCDALVDAGKLGFTFPAGKVKYTCPVGMKSISSKGVKGCYFTEIKLPKDGPEIRPYCAYLNRGYLGFSFHQNE